MKYSLSQDEIKTIVSDHLQSKFQAGCSFDCTASPGYGDWEFAEMTDAYLEEKAKREERSRQWEADYKAKKESEEAAKAAIGTASDDSAPF